MLQLPLPEVDDATSTVAATATNASIGVATLNALAEEQHGDDNDHDRLERPDQRHVEEARLVDRGERRRGAGCEERAGAEHE